MQRLWFITNPNSGTTSHAKCKALEAVFEERGLTLVGRTDFPDEPLPDPSDLDAEQVDTLVLFAGDGTINAALCKFADWQGRFLILPGGTMNLLAKALHDETDAHKIVHAAHEAARTVALPYVEAGPHRAFVGLIVGPAAQWFEAREAARKWRLSSLPGAIRKAMRRTFGARGIRIRGVEGGEQGFQAVFVLPSSDGLDVTAIDARDWRAIMGLGWEWLTGDWVAARAVTKARPRRLTLVGTRPVLALFDGEPVRLDPREPVVGGMSPPVFLSTRAEVTP